MAERVPQWSVLPSACVVWLTLLWSRSKRKKNPRFSNTVKENYISYDDKSLIQLFEVVGRRLKLADTSSDSLPMKSRGHTVCQDQSLICKMCLLVINIWWTKGVVCSSIAWSKWLFGYLLIFEPAETSAVPYQVGSRSIVLQMSNLVLTRV